MKLRPDAENTERARDYALKLLAYRPRSRAELQTRLARKGYTEETIAEVLASLERVGWVDDPQFAGSWVRSQMRTNPMGQARLRWELGQKGIDREIAEAAIAAEVDEEVELQQARAVAAKARPQLARLDDRTASRRLAARLARRGFLSEVIRHVLQETFPDDKDITD